eukprot:3470976-Ditylum_brightwellii.AAC.1
MAEPWESMQVDLFGPWTSAAQNGEKVKIHAIGMIDTCTRWVELHPLQDKTSETISLIVDREWFCCYLRPSQVIYDNGSEFTSEW